MKKQSKNILLAITLCSVLPFLNTGFAQELQPSLLTEKKELSSQHFKKIRQSKALAIHTVKRASVPTSKAPKHNKGQYLIHGSLPSDRYDAQ
ncbi:hypothetical protein [Alteromonas gracilis]|uniref:hypothetical protein n=1 Tax=Alteromonas gracilis TaxID=1479524 RepID=UPI0037355578